MRAIEQRDAAALAARLAEPLGAALAAALAASDRAGEAAQRLQIAAADRFGEAADALALEAGSTYLPYAGSLRVVAVERVAAGEARAVVVVVTTPPTSVDPGTGGAGAAGAVGAGAAPPTQQQLRLVEQGGAWRVVAGEPFRVAIETARLRHRAAALTVLALRYDAISERIARGELSGVDALRDRLREAAGRGVPPIAGAASGATR